MLHDTRPADIPSRGRAWDHIPRTLSGAVMKRRAPCDCLEATMVKTRSASGRPSHDVSILRDCGVWYGEGGISDITRKSSGPM